jgi:CheY-like chemotaxis protein
MNVPDSLMYLDILDKTISQNSPQDVSTGVYKKIQAGRRDNASPVRRPPLAMDDAKTTDFEKNEKPRLKILVVDDDDINRRLMKVLLGREGYDVDLAANGLEALEAVKEARYDIVFMDLQMPVMDGVEASRRIREWEEGVSPTFLVALTASYLPEEGHILYEAGIDNYISKPFQFDHVQRMLKYIANARTNSVIAQKPSISDSPSLH